MCIRKKQCFPLHTFIDTALVLPGIYESSLPLSRVGYRSEAPLLSFTVALLEPLRELQNSVRGSLQDVAHTVPQDSSVEMPRAWGRDMDIPMLLEQPILHSFSSTQTRRYASVGDVSVSVLGT